MSMTGLLIDPYRPMFVESIDIKRKNRLLKVCCVLVTSAPFLDFSFSFFLAVAINTTNEINKAGSTCH